MKLALWEQSCKAVKPSFSADRGETQRPNHSVLGHATNQPRGQTYYHLPLTLLMSRPRSSKSSEDFPASTLTFPAKLVRKFASRKEPKALAALSSSIALSTSSAFSNAHGTPRDYATSPGRVTSWQTAYAAAKMAVEIAKESSDMFPPLKAVVGAMSVLFQNYDVSMFRLPTEHFLNLYLGIAPANNG